MRNGLLLQNAEPLYVQTFYLPEVQARSPTAILINVSGYSQCIPNRGWLCVQGLNATYSNVTGTSSGAKERASPVTVTANSGAKIAPVVVPQPSPIFQSSGSSTGSYAANPSGGTRCSSSSYSSSSGTRSSQNSSPSGCYSSSSSSNSGLPGTNAFFTQQSSSSGTQPGAAAKGEIPPIGGLPGALSFLQKPKGSEGIKGKKVEAVGDGDQVAVAEDEDVELAKRREDEDIELAKRRGDEAAELAKRKGDEALEKRREVLDRSMKKRNIRMRRGG